jgi:hypothetical protein
MLGVEQRLAIFWPPGDRFWKAPVDVDEVVCVPVDVVWVPVPVGVIAVDWAQAGAVRHSAAPRM